MGLLTLALVLNMAGSGAFAQATVDQHDAQAEASSRVEVFHAALIEALQLPDHVGREALLAPHIDAAFDIERIAGISLGRTWRSLSESQQAGFVELLRTLVAATYADRFDNFSGQRFTTDGVEPVKSGYVVRTRLTRDGEPDVALQYFVRDGRIFNVVADGVSDLSLRRADYNSIIKAEGYEALLAHIEGKIALARGGQ